METAEKSMLAELPMLMEVFHSCCDVRFTNESDNAKDNVEAALDDVEEDKDVSAEAREMMVKIILSKTTHSYFNAHLKFFQQETVKRKGKDYTSSTFRGRLKTTGLKKKPPPAAAAKTDNDQVATEKEEDNN